MKKKYGEAAKKHAVNLRVISGFSYAEIYHETGIPEGYVRRLVHESKRPLVTGGTQEVAETEKEVTAKSNAVTPQETGKEPVKNTAEMQVLKETDVTIPNLFQRHFGLMDVAFYTLNGTACFAMWNTAPGVVGASMATIYCLFSLDAILRVKRADMPNTAGAAANRVIFLEVIAAIFHFRLIDAYLWHNLDKLPFSVYQTAGNGVNDYRRMDGDVCLNCYWHNGDWVHFIAGLMAFLMAAAACHAVFFAKQAAIEAAKK